MQLIPDVKTGFLDPFRIEKTLAFNFSIINPRTGEPYHRDPRGVAERAEAYLESTGIADTAFFAPEAEFFIFEDVRYESSPQGAFYQIDSDEAPWNTGRKEEGGNQGYKTPFKAATSRSPPPTSRPTCATRSALSWIMSGWKSSAATTRWVPLARRKSTTSSTPWCTRPMS